MSILNNAPDCETGGNTGVAENGCVVDPKLLQFIIKVPNNFELLAADLVSAETVMAKLRTLAVADSRTERIYPFPPQVTFTDNSTDPSFQTFGSGSSIPSNEGMYNWMFQFTKGGKCLNDQLRKFNSASNARFLVVDATGRLFGARGNSTFKGIPSNYLYTDKLKVAAYDAVTVYAYRVDFMPNYFNEDSYSIQLSLGDLRELSGLQNVVPEQISAKPANTFTARLNVGCGGGYEDFYDLFATELADPTNFTITRASTGNAITITSVAAVPNSKAFLFTMDATDPDYSAGADVVLKGSTVSALSGNDVVGYEILPKTIVATV